jgi:dTDP-4-dehydrorhamnose reductase
VSLSQQQRCRWLVVGSAGMLGRDLVAALGDAGEEVLGRTHRQLDVTDEAAVRAAVHDCRPDVVVNCAAWTAVDDAEAHENEALGVNGHGAAHLAAACAADRVRLVHMSTDYVFGGDASRPYAEHDAAGPRTAYGRTKLAGEQAVLRLLPRSGYVVRTAWLYGAHGPNFVSTMIRLERERPTVDVVADQSGQPTWTADVAGQIIALVRSPGAAGAAGAGAAAGIYHATSSGEATWFDLAREVFRLLGADPARVRPTTSSAYPRPAPRPGYSVLGHDGWASAGIEPIGDWRLALRRALPGLLPPDHPRSCTPSVQVGLTRYGR